MKSRIFLLFFLFLGIVYADVPAIGDNAPAPNYQEFFPNESNITAGMASGEVDSEDNKKMVGDDQVPTRSSFNTYTSETGFATHTVDINEMGLTEVKDKDGNKIDYFDEKKITNQTYLDVMKKLKDDRKALDDFRKIDSNYNQILKERNEAYSNGDMDTYRAKTKEKNFYEMNSPKLKELRDKLNEDLQESSIVNKNLTFERENHFKGINKVVVDNPKNKNVSAKGRQVTNSFTNDDFTDGRRGRTDADRELLEGDKNMSKFYKAHFGINPDLANFDESIKDTDTNAGRIKKAYELVEEYEKLAKGKLNRGIIACYITRELMPSFYCPFPDMTNTLYPDYTNTEGDAFKATSAEAEAECNDNCNKKRSCVAYKVLDEKEPDLNLGNRDIYPYNNSSSEIFINSTELMAVSTLEFDIEVTKSNEFEGTDEEFDEWIREQPVKISFMTSIARIDDRLDEDHRIIMLYDTAPTTIRGSKTHRIFRLNSAGTKFRLQLYEPYVYTGSAYMNAKNHRIMKYISKVTVKNIKITYENDSLYFCPFRQFVDSASECLNGKILDVVSDNAVYHVCTNVDHKIGPDAINGGFYSEDSCESSCIEHEDCKPTYKQYANSSGFATDAVYKVIVGCVDNDSNAGCTDALCQSYFADPEKRPINEIVIQKDNERVYTVKNKLLTGVQRPKIDYDAEMQTGTVDYKELFQREMKDAAYKSMLDNQTYDKIKYLVDEISPLKTAVSVNNIDGRKVIDILYKPYSNDYDNGQSYNLYVVMKFEQSFRPAYGMYMIGGHLINAETQPVQFKDDTYAVFNGNDWKVYKKTFFSKVKSTEYVLVCKEGTEYEEREYFENRAIPSNCIKQMQVKWNDLPAYKTSSFLSYSDRDRNFRSLSKYTLADIVKVEEFSSDLIERSIRVTNDLFQDIQHIPGGLIRSQLPKDHDAQFIRVWDGDFNARQRGYTANVHLYFYYSRDRLNYGDIDDRIAHDEGIVWDLANSSKYPSRIQEDGQIANNIRVFKVGTKDKITVQTEVQPKIEEEGKRVFQFLFLYDKDIDPFEDN